MEEFHFINNTNKFNEMELIYISFFIKKRVIFLLK